MPPSNSQYQFSVYYVFVQLIRLILTNHGVVLKRINDEVTALKCLDIINNKKRISGVLKLGIVCSGKKDLSKQL